MSSIKFDLPGMSNFIGTFFFVVFIALFASETDAQTALSNGGNHDGTVSVGGQESYKFTGNSGDNIQLRVGAVGFSPRIELYAPGGALLKTGFTANTAYRDAIVSTQLTSAGEYSVIVKSQYAASSGNYRLAFAKSPGSFEVPVGDNGGPLNNGTSTEATLVVGDLDMWSFTAMNGEGIIIRVGAIDFSPRIDLYGPDGTLLKSEFTANSGFRDIVLYHKASTEGSYTVVVSSYYLNDFGSYRITLAQVPGEFSPGIGDEGGELPNGVLKEGIIRVGDLDMWSFSAGSGDGIVIRTGTTNFSPRIDLYGPDGTLLISEFTANSAFRDAGFRYQAASEGIYTAVVSSYYLNNSGSYGITLAKIPGAFATAPGDEGGELTNGFTKTGTIPVGDIDLWTFNGNSGDNIQIRVGTIGFSPRLDLYGPDGSLISSEFTANSGFRDALLLAGLTSSGTYTIIVSSYYYNVAGSYALSMLRAPGNFSTAPGDEGGALINGGIKSGNLPVGDIDLWGFNANGGESIQIRVGANGFSPRIDLYGADGTLLKSAFTANSGYRDASLSLQLPASGDYTLVISSYYLNQTGDYKLSFAKFPGEFQTLPDDEGGALTNGMTHAGTIPVGDLDVWTFVGQTGDFVQLRVGTTTFSPQLDLYGPDGHLLESAATDNSGFRDASLIYRLINSGTFSVAVSSHYLNAVGDYNLNFAVNRGAVETLPGDEGGQMINGFIYSGTNTVGDLDVWQFYGTPGDSNVFRIGTIGFTPWLRLYDFDGELVKEVFTANSGNRTNSMSFVVTNAGMYTLVSSAYYLNQSGTYNLKQSRVAPDLNVPDNQEIDELTTLSVGINAQDPDDANKPLHFALLSGPPGITLNQPGATNATLTWITSETHGRSTNEIVVTVTDRVDGKDFIRTNSFQVIVREINTVPHLVTPQTVTLDELTPIALPVTASDDDVPQNPLNFSLIDAPPGMQINPSTGAITWLPTEMQGPANYNVGVVVTDENLIASNETHLSQTNRVNIQVREVNLPPRLSAPANQTIDENTLLSVSATAADDDLPLNILTFSLINPPQGMAINPANGQITWQTSEADGPGSYDIQVQVSDNGSPALIQSASFTVVVREINSAPTVAIPATQTINELESWSVTAAGADPDNVGNTLSYTLQSAPQGMTINPQSGVISWTPTEAQGPQSYEISVVVTDSGTPSLSGTNKFGVSVAEVNTLPELQPIADLSVNIGANVSVQANGSDSDLPANTLTYSVEQGPTGLAVDPNTGRITWTPGQSQVGKHTVVIRLSDDATTPGSVTQSFEITVVGVGTQLQISRVGNLAQITITGDINQRYELQKTADLKEWTPLLEFQLTTSPYQYVDPEPATNLIRCYRLKLIP